MRVRQQRGGLQGSAQPQALRLRKGRAVCTSPRPSSAGARAPNDLLEENQGTGENTRKRGGSKGGQRDPKGWAEPSATSCC